MESDEAVVEVEGVCVEAVISGAGSVGGVVDRVELETVVDVVGCVVTGVLVAVEAVPVCAEGAVDVEVTEPPVEGVVVPTLDVVDVEVAVVTVVVVVVEVWVDPVVSTTV